MTLAINSIIADELSIEKNQVASTISLLNQGNTIPFIARYRKEATHGLDDTQLRHLYARLIYLREVESRQETIIKSITEQNKLTLKLKQKIICTINKTELEDLYLPYKPKRHTKGQIAAQAGLTPLARSLWEDQITNLSLVTVPYINKNKGVEDHQSALDGAQSILIEQLAEDALLLKKLRIYLKNNAYLESQVIKGKEQEGIKYKDYFTHDEAIKKIPSHRVLAILRGKNAGILRIKLNSDPSQEPEMKTSYCELMIQNHYHLSANQVPINIWRQQVIHKAWKTKIAPRMETEFINQLKEQAEDEAMRVFANNLKDLLMAPPAGSKITLALDPGYRNGVKLAVVDGVGRLIDYAVIYPFPPQKKTHDAQKTLLSLIKKHQVELIAIGNGTASRESENLVKDLLQQNNLNIPQAMVSEAGASVYSASELAALEFPNVDVSIRGAASIAKRLQDPLAELVKVDPKSIGVGQYQHDVNQTQLAQRLNDVVEDCVNAVGVDVNMASVPLLTQVAGLNKTIAQNIVAYRNEHGKFTQRKQLKKIARLGPKAFEQCAGFLRILDGDNQLDASAVHPEAYPIVKMIQDKTGKNISEILGNSTLLNHLNPNDYVTSRFGRPTIIDIIHELDKPGRDPRPEFKTAVFSDKISKPEDLIPGMILEGVVSNVANFGAFVDIGVHQDGLIHISALSNKFISDPRDVVKAGDIVKVKVIDIDLIRKRIALSLRLTDPENIDPHNQPSPLTKKIKTRETKASPNNSILADALMKAKKR